MIEASVCMVVAPAYFNKCDARTMNGVFSVKVRAHLLQE
jgi:hypothetical protein